MDEGPWRATIWDERGWIPPALLALGRIIIGDATSADRRGQQTVAVADDVREFPSGPRRGLFRHGKNGGGGEAQNAAGSRGPVTITLPSGLRRPPRWNEAGHQVLQVARYGLPGGDSCLIESMRSRTLGEQIGTGGEVPPHWRGAVAGSDPITCIEGAKTKGDSGKRQ